MSYAGNSRADQDLSNPQQESTGPVASDSLAAESIDSGGAFSSNRNAQPLGVRGDQSTLNNSDTSAATKLDAADDGTSRESASDVTSGQTGSAGGLKYPDATGGQGDDSSAHTQHGFASGPSDASSSSAPSQHGQTSSSSETVTGTGSGTGASSGATGVRPYVDQAPTYTANVTGSNLDPATDLQPKSSGQIYEGKDLPESTKTFTGNVGGQYDPGRLAEKDFQKANAAGIESSGTIGDRSDVRVGDGDDGKGAYGVLESERA